MEYFLRGFGDVTTDSDEHHRRMATIMRYIGQETAASVMQSIISLLGKEHNEDGTHRWPYIICHILHKDSFSSTESLVWSAFCYHNEIPFGMMVAYPHHKGLLQDEAAYIHLMDTWCTNMQEDIVSMGSLLVKTESKM